MAAFGNKMVKWAAIVLAVLCFDVVAGVLIGKKLLVPKLYGTEEFAEQQEALDDQKEKPAADTTAPGIVRQLDPINLNPARSNGEIFSCELTIEANDQKVIDEVAVRNSQIKDIILTYLSYRTVEELNDVTNRTLYRDELKEKINSVLTSGDISNLYITQWILQYN